MTVLFIVRIMKPPASGRRPHSYIQQPQRRRNRRRHRAPYSFLRRSGIAAALLLFGIYAAMQYFMPQRMEAALSNTPPRQSNEATPAQLSGRGSSLYIYDGDTIAIQGLRIRLKGMDTPETQQNCQLDGKDYACGRTATTELRKLIGNQTVTCTADGRDRYDRILAFCKAGETDLNRTLVEKGWAVSYGLYQREEADARKNKRGLWAGDFEKPGKWRQINQSRTNDRNPSN